MPTKRTKKPRVKKKPGPKKGNGGRPKLFIDLEKVRLLATVQCTDEEIASTLGINQSSFAMRKKNDPELFDTIKRARDDGNTSVRHAQFQKAMEGNTTMLIWYGKQYLGQSDKSEDKSTVDKTVKQTVTHKVENEIDASAEILRILQGTGIKESISAKVNPSTLN